MKVGINTFTLKVIAMTAMVIDHVGAVLLPQYLMLRIIGRIAFPIYVYLLVEGFFYTHDVKKYMMRMGILALLSEIPYDLAFRHSFISFEIQNVFFTLFLGLVMLCLIQRIQHVPLVFVCVAGLFVLSEVLNVDYGYCGLLLILWCYYYRNQKYMKWIGFVIVNVLLMGGVQIYGLLALIPIMFHNGKEGPKMKFFFYGFYPVHLLFIYIISIVL